MSPNTECQVPCVGGQKKNGGNQLTKTSPIKLRLLGDVSPKNTISLPTPQHSGQILDKLSPVITHPHPVEIA